MYEHLKDVFARFIIFSDFQIQVPKKWPLQHYFLICLRAEWLPKFASCCWNIFYKIIYILKVRHGVNNIKSVIFIFILIASKFAFLENWSFSKKSLSFHLCFAFYITKFFDLLSSHKLSQLSTLHLKPFFII